MKILRRLKRDEHADPRDYPDSALIEFENDAGDICHGAELDGEIVECALVTPGPALAAKLAADAVLSEAADDAAAALRAERADLAARAKAGTLTAAELQRAIEILMGGGAP